MWIQRHDGSLINIEKYCEINSEKTNLGYEVYCRSNGKGYLLATYEEEQQAKEAKTAIFCSMRNGNKAMTMPYYVMDWGEDV